MKSGEATTPNPLSVKLNKKVFQPQIDKRLQGDPALGMLGKHKLQVTEQGLTVMTSVNSSFQTWAGVHSIQEDDQYIFIYTTPISAHIIPKRAFNTPLE
jgi:hypothetical protein